MSRGKPKNYYSLNLTEGRIFIIFISILIIVTVVAFGIALIISNNRKANDVNVSLDNEEDLNLNSEDFSFYNELDENNKVESFIEDKSEIKEVKTESDEFKVKVQEKKEKVASKAEKTITNDNKDVVKIDESEVVYSSKYIEDDEKKEEKKVINNTKKTTVNTASSKTQTQPQVVFERRYIVQVGSYINKKTAEEISLYYKIQGYPAYITETVKSKKTYYRLRIGPFKDKERAEKYLASLKSSKYGDKSYISIVYL